MAVSRERIAEPTLPRYAIGDAIRDAIRDAIGDAIGPRNI
jgi:hypothetical protein